MSDTGPRVAVAIPVYNGEAYLAQAIDSLIAQDCSGIEITLIDNASTDSTAEICRTYADQYDHVRYVGNERNIGAGPNFNKAFHLTSGAYFKWAAADDLISPNYLRLCADALDRDPGAVSTLR